LKKGFFPDASGINPANIFTVDRKLLRLFLSNQESFLLQVALFFEKLQIESYFLLVVFYRQ